MLRMANEANKALKVSKKMNNLIALTVLFLQQRRSSQACCRLNVLKNQKADLVKRKQKMI